MSSVKELKQEIQVLEGKICVLKEAIIELSKDLEKSDDIADKIFLRGQISSRDDQISKKEDQICKKEDQISMKEGQILEMIKQTSSFSAGNAISMPMPSLNPLSMAEANNDLRDRQRAFSIKATLEELRKDWLVMKDAVLPGKVDSRSMYEAAPAPADPTPKKEATPAAPANTTPSQAKKVVKEVPAAPVAAPVSAEAAAAVSEVVDHVPAAAANLATISPTASESAHMLSPQKITPPTWATLLKSSASAAAVKEAKRAPTKESAFASAAKFPKPEKDAASSNGSVTASSNGRRKAVPGTPSRGNASTAEKTEGETKTDTANVSWGGKASFANILKLSSESEPFVPAAAPTAPKATALKDTAASANKDDRRKRDRSPAKAAVPAASTTAAAATDAKDEWSTSTGKSRPPRENRNKEAKPAAAVPGADSTANSGAYAKGAWARETFPALPQIKA